MDRFLSALELLEALARLCCCLEAEGEAERLARCGVVELVAGDRLLCFRVRCDRVGWSMERVVHAPVLDLDPDAFRGDRSLQYFHGAPPDYLYRRRFPSCISYDQPQTLKRM